jgi:hypothetical protein
LAFSYSFGVKTQRLTVALAPPVTRAAIKAAAGRNVSKWVRDALAAALQEHRRKTEAPWAELRRRPGRRLSWEETQRLCPLE